MTELASAAPSKDAAAPDASLLLASSHHYSANDSTSSFLAEAKAEAEANPSQEKAVAGKSEKAVCADRDPMMSKDGAARDDDESDTAFADDEAASMTGARFDPSTTVIDPDQGSPKSRRYSPDARASSDDSAAEAAATDATMADNTTKSTASSSSIASMPTPSGRAANANEIIGERAQDNEQQKTLPNSSNPKSSSSTYISSCLSPSKLSTPCGVQALSRASRRGRGVGWGHLPGVHGLRGGADTMSNGTSGWGPPPAPAGGGANSNASGWGSVPANPGGSAWGAPEGNSNSDNATNNDGSGAKAGPPASSAPTQPSNSVAPPSVATGSTSWASAASKGLPVSNNDSSSSAPNGQQQQQQQGAGAAGSSGGNGGNGASTGSSSAASTTTSKQLEQLNSVREALFSQDGWGGNNVKQDTSWDVDTPSVGSGGGAGAAGNVAGAGGVVGSGRTANGMDAAMGKDSNMWGGVSANGMPRNDGTDLWKASLTGQPIAQKQAPANPWDHKPVNPADFKNWGEDDDSPSGPRDNNDQFWGRQDHGQFNKPHPNDWKNDPRGPPPNSAPGGWGEPMAGRGGVDMMPGGGGGRGPDGWGPRQPQQPPGPPPPPSQHWGAGPGGRGPAGWGGMPGGGPGDHDSPNMQRRNPGMDDTHGTSLWGQPKPQGTERGGSQWKEMPQQPTPMNRVPGGGPPGVVPGPGGGRMMPPVGGAGGPKEPWGAPGGAPGQMGGPPGRAGGGSGWGDEPPTLGGGGGGSGWGDADPMKRETSGWGSAPNAMDGPGSHQWKAQQRGAVGGPLGGPIRQSPNWEDHPGASGGGPLDGPGWGGHGGKNEPPMPGKMGPGLSKEAIWNSKQFRILCDMGYPKDDVEAVLRNTGCRLDDALEILNRSRGMQVHGGGAGMPGGAGADHPYGDQPGMDGRGGGGMRPPPHASFGGGPGAGGPFHPDHPGGPLNGPQKGGGIPSPAAVAGLLSAQQGRNPGGGGGPPNAGLPPAAAAAAPSSSQPSAQQLRILVQQIQMAVQAGHLNPAILNQPLAPQTLILLNQLLQQIKALQTYQQQHNYSRTNVNATGPALMNMTVKITQTKQQIQNLQNQISAQQANYLKATGAAGGGPGGGGGGLHQPQPPLPNQMPPPMPPPHVGPAGDGPSVGSGSTAVQEMFQGLSLMGSGAGASENGSRLAQWKQAKDGPSGASGFPKAPGPSSKQQPGGGGGSNLLLEDARWSLNSDSNGGWPETSKAGGSGGGDAADSFGIPEFEPGKPWKGTGLKNPDEDPNLTPGSMAALPIGPLSKAGSTSNLASAPTSTAADSGLTGLTSSPWSFQQQGKQGEGGNSASSANPATKSSDWPTSNGPATSASTTLTQIGQDLWGKSGPGKTPPGLGVVSSTAGGWPVTSTAGASSSSNGWSAGLNGFEGQGWLLLKNLTPQIDGSTLKTLCIQHGPLQHFDLYLNHAIALVKYRSPEEAIKAQKALHQCLLGNTTIHANTATDNEVSMILQQLGVNPQQSAAAATSAATPMTSSSLLPSSSAADTWGNPGGGAPSSVWSVGTEENPRTTPLNSLLPGDLLGENM